MNYKRSLGWLVAGPIMLGLSAGNSLTTSEPQISTRSTVRRILITTTVFMLEAPLTSADGPKPNPDHEIKRGALISPATINDPCPHSDLGPARSPNAQYTSWTSCLAAVYESAYSSKFGSTSTRSLSTNQAKPTATAVVWMAAPAIAIIGGALPLL